MQREPADIMVGLSVGTTKVSAIVAEVEHDSRYPNPVQVLGIGCAPSRGLSKGVITNLSDATKSVRKALDDAANIVNRNIESVTVAFNSLDVQSVITHGMVAIEGRVDSTDFKRAIEAAQSSLETSSNMLAVHTIPVRYSLDGHSVDEPLNMTGSRLEITLQTVFVPKSYVQNVITCVEDGARVKVDGLVLKPLAASLGALLDDEMEAGCISLSIGGGTTGLVLYQAGRPFKIMSIPIGGEHITNDLVEMLRISRVEAENVKKRLFIPEEEDALIREGIDVDYAIQVIGARIGELFEDHVRVALADCSPQSFSGGVILSGGVAKIPGITEMLGDILQMKVRFGQPCYSMPPGREGVSYVSEAGLIRYPIYRKRYSHMFIDPPATDILMGTNTNQGQNKQQHDTRDQRERTPSPYSQRGDRGYGVNQRITRNDEESYEPNYEPDDSDDYYPEDDPYAEPKRSGVKLREFLSNMKEQLGKLF